MYDRTTAATGPMSEACCEQAAPLGASIGQFSREEQRGMKSSFPIPPPGSNGRGEIASALEIQEKATVELLGVIKALTQKLQPVISPCPAGDNNKIGGTDAGSAVARCIQENTARVRNAAQQLAELVRDVAV